ncbi:hypothetical protein F4861DRAFT_516003 [Xylaria intraflava]|nr:hypothetical protein F4861DRAFT_516003 [Xylaria intraflava]
MPSDRVIPRPVIEEAFGSEHIDYSFFEPGYHDETPDRNYQPNRAIARAQTVRLLVRAIAQSWRDDDVHIVLVSHGTFIQYLINFGRALFPTGEWRSYRFRDLVGRDLDANLVETSESYGRVTLGHAPLKPATLNCDSTNTGLSNDRGRRRTSKSVLGPNKFSNPFDREAPLMGSMSELGHVLTRRAPGCCCGGSGIKCIHYPQD